MEFLIFSPQPSILAPEPSFLTGSSKNWVLYPIKECRTAAESSRLLHVHRASFCHQLGPSLARYLRACLIFEVGELSRYPGESGP